MSPSLSAKETTSINMVAGLHGMQSNTSYAYGVFVDNFLNKCIQMHRVLKKMANNQGRFHLREE